MNEARREALAAIRFFAENGRVDNVYKMLIQELEYDPSLAMETAVWLTEHFEHPQIWLAAN